MMVDIDKMEAGREMDLRVAEMMGWRWDGDWGCLIPPEQIARPSEMWTDWHAGLHSYEVYREPVKENLVSGIVYSGDSSKIIMPQWSTDIAAAWEVAEKMSSLGFIAKLWSPGQDVCFPHFAMSAQNWECSFWKYVNKHTGEPYEFGRDSWDDSKEILGRGISPSPSLAICRAALKAVKLLEKEKSER